MNRSEEGVEPRSEGVDRAESQRDATKSVDVSEGGQQAESALGDARVEQADGPADLAATQSGGCPFSLSRLRDKGDQSSASWHDYFTLCKPRVVALMLLTTWVGMYVVSPSFIPLSLVVATTLGVALLSSAAAALNHVIDRHRDAKMHRTKSRPLPAGALTIGQALWFALILASIGFGVLMIYVNQLTAVLTLATLLGYGWFYTSYLKRSTPQNIVIGGLFGAMPPLLGWTAVTGQIDPQGLLLVLIIFAWTPAHFWALAIYRYEDYKKIDIPMLPVTHGIPYTKLQILLYTVLTVVVSLLPFIVGLSGVPYLLGVMVLNVCFLYWAIRLYRTDDAFVAMKLFRFSNVYLMALFMMILVDHFWGLLS